MPWLAKMVWEKSEKNVDFNFWTVGTIGHRELPAFLERELETYRRSLTALGMAK